MEEWHVTEKCINGRMAWNSEIDKLRKGIRNRRKRVIWKEGQKVGKRGGEITEDVPKAKINNLLKIMTNYFKITDGISRDGGGCFT